MKFFKQHQKSFGMLNNLMIYRELFQKKSLYLSCHHHLKQKIQKIGQYCGIISTKVKVLSLFNQLSMYGKNIKIDIIIFWYLSSRNFILLLKFIFISFNNQIGKINFVIFKKLISLIFDSFDSNLDNCPLKNMPVL